MKRRTLLRGTGALVAGGLAGCIGGNGGGGGGTNTPAPSVANTTTSTDVTSGGCSIERGYATRDGQVLVFTSESVSELCRRLVVEQATYDPDADRLSLSTRSERPSGACAQALGTACHTVTVSFDPSLPDISEVRVNGQSLPEVAMDGGSAPSLHDSSLTVTDITESEQPLTAEVSFDSETNTVTIDGVIQGSDGCATAALGDVSYDASSDTLSVDVVTQPREGSEDRACTAALVYISYEATIEFDDGLPGEVTISHDGDPVASGGYESASATAEPGS